MTTETATAAILAALPHPDHVSASEYRAIYEELSTALECAEYDEGDTPRAYALAICDEFARWAQSMRATIQREVSA